MLAYLVALPTCSRAAGSVEGALAPENRSCGGT